GVTVPRVIGWSDEGLIALTELSGTEAQKVPVRLDDEFLEKVRELADHIATVPSAEPARESLVDRLAWYLSRLNTLQPENKAALSRLAHGIRQLLFEGRSGTVTLVTIHGDLHAGQIFIGASPGSTDTGLNITELVITGLLDIDTAGLGDPADDSAAFYAHLLVLAGHLRQAGKRDTAAHIEALAHSWRAGWLRDGDPGFTARARAIAATHLLGHALRQPPDGIAIILDLAEGIVFGEHA
ncbi:MAG TPA: phosphotransferase, partial [Terrimesophilobacter sp.]|nr:phosphotransferase [Terrimesophilobacter sp.]